MKSGNFGGSRNMGGPYGGGIVYVLTCLGAKQSGWALVFWGGGRDDRVRGNCFQRKEGRLRLDIRKEL